MEGVLLAIGTGAASFIGTWAAHKVHLYYLRRDVNLAHARLDRVEKEVFGIESVTPLG